MAPSVSLAIPYEPVAARKSRDLQSEVQKIVRQRGQFRKVTEKSLLEDIERSKLDEDRIDVAEDDGSETVHDDFEKLWQNRKEMRERIGYALNEALSVLDAISLTASGHSATAQATMSPALKQLVPAGGFRPKLTEPAELTLGAKKRLNDLSLVSRSQSFQSASEKFEKTFQRLQVQAQNQSKYWEEIASLRNTGWQVSRLPRDKKAIVAYVGAADASAQFQGRSITHIRQGEDGDVFIPGHTESRKPKTLVVQVLRSNAVTGQFVSEQKFSESPYKVHQDLIHARDTLFVEELFTEASKEARLIANNGVQARSSSITFDVSDDHTVRISHAHNHTISPIEDCPDDDLAAAVGNTLRLMLVAEYQQRHVRRSEHPPRPMTQAAQALPESMILKPVINLLRHQTATSPVLQLLDDYKASLKNSGFDMSYSVDNTTTNKTDKSDLRALKQVLASRISIKLPTSMSLLITIETFLAPPRFGTQFSIQKLGTEDEVGGLRLLSTFNAVKRTLSEGISHDLTNLILQHFSDEADLDPEAFYPIQLLSGDKEDPPLSLTVRCDDGRLTLLGLRDGQDSPQQATWIASQREFVASLLDTADSWLAEIKET